MDPMSWHKRKQIFCIEANTSLRSLAMKFLQKFTFHWKFWDSTSIIAVKEIFPCKLFLRLLKIEENKCFESKKPETRAWRKLVERVSRGKCKLPASDYKCKSEDKCLLLVLALWLAEKSKHYSWQGNLNKFKKVLRSLQICELFDSKHKVECERRNFCSCRLSDDDSVY